MNYWMVKSEPEAYSWQQLVKDGKTVWTGVRNYQARNNLRAMKKGDAVFFYHSVTDKQVVGLARVVKEAYADATAEEGDWSCVDLAPATATVSAVRGARTSPANPTNARTHAAALPARTT